MYHYRLCLHPRSDSPADQTMPRKLHLHWSRRYDPAYVTPPMVKEFQLCVASESSIIYVSLLNPESDPQRLEKKQKHKRSCVLPQVCEEARKNELKFALHQTFTQLGPQIRGTTVSAISSKFPTVSGPKHRLFTLGSKDLGSIVKKVPPYSQKRRR